MENVSNDTEHRANLIALLQGLKPIDGCEFKMEDYMEYTPEQKFDRLVDHYDEDQIEWILEQESNVDEIRAMPEDADYLDAYKECPACACLLGFSALMGIGTTCVRSWNIYSQHSFGMTEGSTDWKWLFHGNWPNDMDQARARMYLYLTNAPEYIEWIAMPLPQSFDIKYSVPTQKEINNLK